MHEHDNGGYTKQQNIGGLIILAVVVIAALCVFLWLIGVAGWPLLVFGFMLILVMTLTIFVIAQRDPDSFEYNANSWYNYDRRRKQARAKKKYRERS